MTDRDPRREAEIREWLATGKRNANSGAYRALLRLLDEARAEIATLRADLKPNWLSALKTIAEQKAEIVRLRDDLLTLARSFNVEGAVKRMLDERLRAAPDASDHEIARAYLDSIEGHLNPEDHCASFVAEVRQRRDRHARRSASGMVMIGKTPLNDAVAAAAEVLLGNWLMAETVTKAVALALYPEHPSAAVIEAMAQAISGLLQDQWVNLLDENRSVYAPDFSGGYDKHYAGKISYRNQALAAYRAHPLWVALYATSPSEPT